MINGNDFMSRIISNFGGQMTTIFQTFEHLANVQVSWLKWSLLATNDHGQISGCHGHGQ